MRTVNPEQHARKRAQILAAAMAEFAQHGLDGTSTARICRRAKIGSGTLFHYFPTKRDLFLALFRDDLHEVAEVREQALAMDDPRAGIDLIVGRQLSELADPHTPGLMAAALIQVNRDAEFAAILQRDEAGTHAALTTLLTRLAADKLAADGREFVFPPDRLAHWMQRLFDAAFFSADEDAEVNARQSAELQQLIAVLLGERS